MRYEFPILFALLVLPVFASQHKNTDAENDGMNGPVKSVITTVEASAPSPHISMKWIPGQKSVVNLCPICMYDPKGNRILTGMQRGDGLHEESTQVVYDNTGDQRERIVTNEKGELVQRMVIGPYGTTEFDLFQGGVLTVKNILAYEDGGLTRVDTITDGRGVQTGRSLQRRDVSGHIVEAWNYGQAGLLLYHFTDIIDPDSGTQTFTEINPDGTVRMTWTARNDHIVSYWQQPSPLSLPGGRVCMDRGPRASVCEMYFEGGSFTEESVEFLDDAKHLPCHTEIRDEHNEVQETADDEYEFDDQGNWTSRTQYVSTKEAPARKLISVCRRIITYWPK